MISLFDAVAGCIFDRATSSFHVPLKGSSCAMTGAIATTNTRSDNRARVTSWLLSPRLREREIGVGPSLFGVDGTGERLAVHADLAFFRDHDDELHQEAIRRTHLAV